jgi:hypothetical protein
MASDEDTSGSSVEEALVGGIPQNRLVPILLR